MQKLNIIYSRIFTSIAFANMLLFAHLVDAAPPGGLRVENKLITVKNFLLTIVPSIAGILLICLGIAYAFDAIEKMSFVRFGVGLLIIGSSSGIVGMLMN